MIPIAQKQVIFLEISAIFLEFNNKDEISGCPNISGIQLVEHLTIFLDFTSNYNILITAIKYRNALVFTQNQYIRA